MDKLLVSTKEAAELLGISRSLFYSMVSTGRLGPKPIKFNSKRLWSVEELAYWVDIGCPTRERWLGIEKIEKNDLKTCQQVNKEHVKTLRRNRYYRKQGAYIFFQFLQIQRLLRKEFEDGKDRTIS